MSVDNYINELKNQRDLLADILTEKGVESSRSEKFNTLIPKVNYIGGGGYECDGIILNIPFTPKNVEKFSLGTAEEVIIEVK